MDTKFWKNLIKGKETEEEIAQLLESFGYNVMRIGAYRLPVDLFVWREQEEFWVEVKYRSKTDCFFYFRDLLTDKGKEGIIDILEETQLPVIVMLKTPVFLKVGVFALGLEIGREGMRVGERGAHIEWRKTIPLRKIYFYSTKEY